MALLSALALSAALAGGILVRLLVEDRPAHGLEVPGHLHEVILALLAPLGGLLDAGQARGF